jgi:hypothetical protein
MTAQAFETRIPPPEAIRGALLLGIVVGQRDDIDDLPTCPACKKQLEQLRDMVFGALEATAEADEVVSSGAVPPP